MPRGVPRTRKEIDAILKAVRGAPHGKKMAVCDKLGIQRSVYYVYKARVEKANPRRKASSK